LARWSSSHFIQHTLTRLQAVERHATTPEQHDAFQESRLILHFIRERGEEGEFTEYFENIDTAAHRTVLTFSTKEEADAWLRNHPAPPHGAIIGVGNARYHLAYLREIEHRRLLALPSLEEEKQWEREAEEEEQQQPEPEAEEPPAPPKQRDATRFSLFDLYNYVCFHFYWMERRGVTFPEELEVLQVAQSAFSFVMRQGEEHGFEAYLESLRSARSASPRLALASREEADAWLEKQPAPPPPRVVSLGDDLYAVGYHRLRARPLLIRLPRPRELDAAAS
jgi:hypothetical protein